MLTQDAPQDTTAVTMDDTTNIADQIGQRVDTFDSGVLEQIHNFLAIQLFNLQNTPVTLYSLILFVIFISVFFGGWKGYQQASL